MLMDVMFRNEKISDQFFDTCVELMPQHTKTYGAKEIATLINILVKSGYGKY